MRRLSLICIAAVLLIAFTFPLYASEGCGEGEGLCVEGVKFYLKGNFQAMAMFKTDETDTLGPVDQFMMGRARLWLKGSVKPEKFYFATQIELTDTIALLDYKFVYDGPYHTKLTFGRFKPNFTHYMPRHTGQLDFIHYPLMVEHLGMDWQMGAQTESRYRFITLNLGIFNGQNIPNNYSDVDKYKDFMARCDLKPEMGAIKTHFGAYGWLGTSKGITTAGESEALANSRLGFIAACNMGGISLRGEYITARDEYIDATNAVDSARNSFYIQAGYKFCKEKLEALVRYDTYDQNTDKDYDGLYWTTIGLNYYFNSWKTMLYLNYIIRNVGGDYSPVESNYMEGENDMVVLQAQMAF